MFYGSDYRRQNGRPANFGPRSLSDKMPADVNMPLPVNSRLGPYEILSTLGVGGMGEVYRAHDSRLHRNVAIKVLQRARSSAGS
jgi:serine/threonine protein kinase